MNIKTLRNIKTLGLMSIAFSLSACATVTRGTKDDVQFVSTPEKADVRVEDMVGEYADQTCVTPCEMELKRNSTFMVYFTKAGFSAISAKLIPKTSGGGKAGMAGNILAGGIIGAAIDGSNGAMKDLLPNPMTVKLNPTGTPSELVIAMTKKEKKAAEKAAKEATKKAKKAEKDAAKAAKKAAKAAEKMAK